MLLTAHVSQTGQITLSGFLSGLYKNGIQISFVICTHLVLYRSLADLHVSFVDLLFMAAVPCHQLCFVP